MKRASSLTLMSMILAGVALAPHPAAGQMVVSDPGVMLEVVNSRIDQLRQYETQLKDYEYTLRDHLAPAMWLWDRAEGTIDRVARLIEFVDSSRRGVEEVDAYLGRFKSVDYYRGSPCFRKGGCPKEELELLTKSREWAANSQKASNEAMFRALDKQYEQLRQDAEHLRLVQSEATNTRGQLEALGYANQLASAQTAQLIQIRGLLVTQQKVALARQQARGDREAQEAAAGAHLRSGQYTPSPKREW